MFESASFAETFMAIAKQRKVEMNITKLHKLLFIVYGTFLAIENCKIMDENPIAWPYGPVFPFDHVIFKSRIKDPDVVYKIDNNIANNCKDIMISVLDYFGEWSAGELVMWLCEEGTPWKDTIIKNNGKDGGVIEDDLIKKYFQNHVINTCV